MQQKNIRFPGSSRQLRQGSDIWTSGRYRQDQLWKINGMLRSFLGVSELGRGFWFEIVFDNQRSICQKKHRL